VTVICSHLLGVHGVSRILIVRGSRPFLDVGARDAVAPGGARLSAKGKFVGQPVVLRPWQRKIVRGIYDTPTRRAIIG